ncbi:hypothetical protein, partial [Methylobacterium tardum]|uniref:hypothetical protein n=1 Tax=Methylobacterium tardum TaxID=374432 RepID=UPI0024E0931C
RARHCALGEDGDLRRGPSFRDRQGIALDHGLYDLELRMNVESRTTDANFVNKIRMGAGAYPGG